MNYLRKFLDFLVLSNAYLALGIAIVAFSLVYMSSPNSDILIGVMVFLMTFSMYSLNRLTDEEEDRINNPQRGPFINKYKKAISIALILAYLLAVSIAILRGINAFIWVMAILVVSILYSVKFIPTRWASAIGFRRFKDLFVGKNVVIALVWAMAMVFLPLSYMSLEVFTLSSAILFAFILMRSFINTTFFDLRDIEGDRINSVKTIPVAFGIIKTKLILMLINLFISTMLLAAVLFSILPPAATILHISTIYSLAYLYMAGKTDMNILCDFVADGEYILLGLLPFIANL
jgi:4-hydroxybenzoate polyprenyltransferase